MKDTEFYNLNFDDIDYDSPLTDDELDYLDIIGVDRIDPIIDRASEEIPSDEKIIRNM